PLSENQFRAIIEHSRDAICLISGEGTILYASPASERVLGYSPEEMMGRSGFELILPSERPEALRRLAELIADPNRSRSVQVRVRRKDGAVIWAEAVGTNFLNEPKIGAIVANFRDITEQKHTEQLLRESEQALRESGDRLSLAVESTELGTWDYDPRTGRR